MNASNNRRQFLKRFAGASIALSASPALGLNSVGSLKKSMPTLLPTEEGGEAFWRLVKELSLIHI